MTRLRETLPKNGQLNLMINILKALPGEINKDDNNYKQVFPKKNLFFHEYLTPHSYLDNNSHTSCLFEILKFIYSTKNTLTSIIL